MRNYYKLIYWTFQKHRLIYLALVCRQLSLVRFEQEVESVALYFNADYALSDKLTLTFGGRYTEDDTEIGAATGAALVDGTILALVDVVADTRTDEDTSFRLGLSYDVNDSSLLYVNLATAFRTGGYSVPFGGTVVDLKMKKWNH